MKKMRTFILCETFYETCIFEMALSSFIHFQIVDVLKTQHNKKWPKERHQNHLPLFEFSPIPIRRNFSLNHNRTRRSKPPIDWELTIYKCDSSQMSSDEFVTTYYQTDPKNPAL